MVAWGWSRLLVVHVYLYWYIHTRTHTLGHCAWIPIKNPTPPPPPPPPPTTSPQWERFGKNESYWLNSCPQPHSFHSEITSQCVTMYTPTVLIGHFIVFLHSSCLQLISHCNQHSHSLAVVSYYCKDMALHITSSIPLPLPTQLIMRKQCLISVFQQFCMYLASIDYTMCLLLYNLSNPTTQSNDGDL